MNDKAIDLLYFLGITNYTQRHLQLTEAFLERENKIRNNVSCQSVCEYYLAQLGDYTACDVQKVQGFVEANYSV